MRGTLGTIIICAVLMSLFELLLPGKNIKKVASSVIGIIVLAIIISPIIGFFSPGDQSFLPKTYTFEQRRE